MNISANAQPRAVATHEVGDPTPTAGTGMRVLTGGLGVAALLVAGLVTLGTAWAAPVGMGLTRWALRRRGRALTRLGSWGAAVGAAAVAIALAFLLVLASLPEGAFTDAMAAAQSAEPPPRPEWLERVAPYPAAPDPTLERVFSSRPATLYFGLIGFGLGCLIMGGFAGTLGWGATLLMGHAVTGRWPLHRRTG